MEERHNKDLFESQKDSRWLHNPCSVALRCTSEDQKVRNSCLQLPILDSRIGLYHVSFP